jgi:hypothetical protein
VSPNIVTKNNYSSSFLDEKTKKAASFIHDFGIEGKYEEDIDLFTGISHI